MEGLWKTVTQFFPPAPKWTADQIPDLSGKVVIVTGGNTGIGKETIRHLLTHNAKVYMASRSKDRAQDAINELKAATGKEALFLRLDLASLASVRKAAEEFMSKEQELHVLFNNGGVMWPPISQLTEDGYDLQFGTNVVGHHFFTQLLVPALRAGSQSSEDKKARVITTSSAAHYRSGLNWDAFVDGPARKSLGTYELYNQSKFGNVVVAREFARRYADQNIVSISLHPGVISTELTRGLPRILQKLSSWLLHPVSYGALTQLWAGTAPETVEHNGKFFIPWARVGVPNPLTQDPEVGERLWTWLEKQVEGK